MVRLAAILVPVALVVFAVATLISTVFGDLAATLGSLG